MILDIAYHADQARALATHWHWCPDCERTFRGCDCVLPLLETQLCLQCFVKRGRKPLLAPGTPAGGLTGLYVKPGAKNEAPE